jgi:hypothetical protein
MYDFVSPNLAPLYEAITQTADYQFLGDASRASYDSLRPEVPELEIPKI